MTTAADFLDAGAGDAAAFLDAKPAPTSLDIPGTPPQPKARPDDPALWKGIPGAAVAAATGMGAQVGGGLLGIVERMTGADMEQAQAAAGEFAERYSYQPSHVGQEALDKAAPALDTMMAVQAALGMPAHVPSAREAAAVPRKLVGPIQPPEEAVKTPPRAPTPAAEAEFPLAESPAPGRVSAESFLEEAPPVEPAAPIAPQSAAAFLEADEARPAKPVPREAEVGDKVASGTPLTAEEREAFPALAKLEEVKTAQAEARKPPGEQPLTEKAKGSDVSAPVEEKAPETEQVADETIQHPDNRPWKTRQAAKDARQEGGYKGYSVVKVDKGYVLKPSPPRSPAQLAALEKRRAVAKTVNPRKDDLPTILGKSGGVSRQALVDLGLDPKDLDHKKGSFRSTELTRPAVRAEGGMSLDGVAEVLDAWGFDVRDEYGALDQSKAADLIEEHMGGSRVFTHEGYEAMAEAEADARALEQAHEAAERAGEDPAKESEEELLAKYGPGTLGSNPFLDPAQLKALIRDTANALKETADKVFRAVFGEPGEFRDLFNPLRDTEQSGLARIERWAAKNGREIREVFKTVAERNDLTLRLVRGDLEGLSPKKRAIAEKLRKNYDAMGQYALDAEKIAGIKRNYSPQIWDMSDPRTKAIIKAFREGKGKELRTDTLAKLLKEGGGSADMFSPFMLRRAIANVEEGMKLGLKPKSLDAADLFETYARSMGSAILRGKTLDALKVLQSADGTLMVWEKDRAPREYVKIDNDELEGWRVHPDIAPAVRVLLQSNNPGVIATIWQTIAYTAKRALVSYSLFHPTSLLQAWEGTLKPGDFASGKFLNPKAAIDAALAKYYEAKLGDVVDKLQAAGLKIGAPLEDMLGRDKFLSLFDMLGKVPGLGKMTEGAKAADKGLQRFTWDYTQTGLKLDAAIRKYEDLMTENAERIANREISEKEIARQAAEFANSTFGGLNWERALDSFDTPLARRIMSEVLSKSGRSAMQGVLMAPDWLVSTLGSWTNALGVTERNALKRSLAQRYLGTSLVITTVIGNALNYYFTGHSMFENKPDKKNPDFGDKVKAMMSVQLGDGRYLNINKHFMEAPHAATDPLQFALNKLNPALALGAEELWNTQWLTSPGHHAPPITTKKDSFEKAVEKRVEHAVGTVAPITFKKIFDDPVAAASGFFGFPMYGMTAEQKAKARAEEKR